MRIAPLAITEEAQKLLRATRADFGNIPTPATAGRGSSFTSSFLGRHDFVQVRNQGEFLRLVSIVEAFIDTCSGQQFDQRTSGRDDFVRKMAAEVRENSVKGWDERKEAFKKYHDITLGECAHWSDIDAAREIRNSIAHGLGQLTERQQNAKTRQKMAALGVMFRGNQLVIGTYT
ncbi:hypothetical protein, partial [Mycobacterium sp.]|uniref:hypothetical protein n=1 Tax=Mycobacterium sp. TaxID=1785 RepID=UPI0025E3E6B3